MKKSLTALLVVAGLGLSVLSAYSAEKAVDAMTRPTRNNAPMKIRLFLITERG